MKTKNNLKTKITGILSNNSDGSLRLSECSVAYAVDITNRYNALMCTSWKVSEENGIISFFIPEPTKMSALEIVSLIRKGIKASTPVEHLLDSLCKVYGGFFAKYETAINAPEKPREPSDFDPQDIQNTIL